MDFFLIYRQAICVCDFALLTQREFYLVYARSNFFVLYAKIYKYLE